MSTGPTSVITVLVRVPFLELPPLRPSTACLPSPTWVCVHIALQAGLEDPTREVAEQTARTGEFRPLGLGPLDELLGELRINHTRSAGRVGHGSCFPRRAAATA